MHIKKIFWRKNKMKCFESPLIDPNWTQQEKDDYLKNYRDPRIQSQLFALIPLAIIAYLVVRK